jgi:hypothetical protein
MPMDAKEKERLARLADPARTHRQLADDAMQARDAAIYEAYAGGAGLRELAQATGLSISQCHRIVIREIADRQVIEVEDAG